MFNDVAERIRAKLHSRVWAYRTLFLTPEQALNEASRVVLSDLARYCYANKPTMKVSHITQQSDPYAMAFAEGRRDVFNRIKAMCNLSDDQINQIAFQRSNDE